MTRKYPKIICKSVFKNGPHVTKDQFTKKWIETVNRFEINKKA